MRDMRRTKSGRMKIRKMRSVEESQKDKIIRRRKK